MNKWTGAKNAPVHLCIGHDFFELERKASVMS
jgi:hypothetical protein